MTKVLFDSVNIDAFPSGGFDGTAGYVNGRYTNSAQMRARWPHLPHVSIAVTRGAVADCLDIEPGNAGPEDGPGWVDAKWNRRLSVPIIYCNTNASTEVRRHLGGREAILWVAHYTYKPHICGPGTCGKPQADGTQWADRGPRGENVDQSLISDRFWQVISGQAPTAARPVEVDLFPLAVVNVAP